jgi:hypothetical protein
MMTKRALGFALLAMLAAGTCAAQQQADAYLGFGTTVGAKGGANGALSCTTTNCPSTQGLNGGLFPVIGGDALIWRGLGFGGEVAWRGSRTDYQGTVPFRPIYWDLNAVYAPRINRMIAPELQAGLGQESLRFYTGQVTCDPFTGTCQNFVSTHHLSGHFGAGLRIYKGNFFIRPEAHIYLVHDNQEFSTGKVGRVGVSLGYSFRR